MSKVLVPVRYAAWLAGELGERIATSLRIGLEPLPAVEVRRLPRGLLVDADESPGVLLEAVIRAMEDVESGVQRQFPVFHHEMGPVWTGTLQSILMAA